MPRPIPALEGLGDMRPLDLVGEGGWESGEFSFECRESALMPFNSLRGACAARIAENSITMSFSLAVRRSLP